VTNSLEKRNYSITLPPGPLPSAPPGGRIYVSGPIATKEGCNVVLDSDRKILISEGTSNEKIIDILEDLTRIAKDDFFVDMDEEVDYLELTSELDILSDADPREKIEDFFEGIEAIKKFNEILGTKTSLFSIDITPKGETPTSKKWFHITIEPRVATPRRVYYVRAVYRDDNKDAVVKFTREINSKILNLIKIIEAS